MDQLKCEHFLDFIFTSGILMDVEYGTTNIKYNSGETQTIAHVVLTVRFKHAIVSYIDMCKSSEFQPLSENSLYRILNHSNHHRGTAYLYWMISWLMD